jgi:hypothetical protein
VTTAFLSHIPVTGLGGRTLADCWAGGAHAYLGTAVAGFPNCYVLYGPNTNLGHNSILFMVERQMNLIMQAMAVQARAITHRAPVRVGVNAAAYRREDERTQRLMEGTAWVANCRSWYKAASGRVTNNWPTWTFRYWYDTLRLRPADLGLTSPTGTGASPSHRSVLHDELANALGPTDTDPHPAAPATR